VVSFQGFHERGWEKGKTLQLYFVLISNCNSGGSWIDFRGSVNMDGDETLQPLV